MIQHTHHPDTEAIKAALRNHVEAVCAHYLSNGRREGTYWRVGDIHNAKGHSLFVRLRGADPSRIGRWQDAATGDYGDLLDIIATSRDLGHFNEVLDEARRFLAMPTRSSKSSFKPRVIKELQSTSEAAQALFLRAKPLLGSLAARWLRQRGINRLDGLDALRFLPHACAYEGDDDKPSFWPAMIASYSDEAGTITGIHRTFLNYHGRAKAPLPSPRKHLGPTIRRGIRFGASDTVMVTGEGIETVLSVREVAPKLSMIAAGSSTHMAALAFPEGLARLYVLDDGDAAAKAALQRLQARGEACSITIMPLRARCGDFNDELRRYSKASLRRTLTGQMLPEDAQRFLGA